MFPGYKPDILSEFGPDTSGKHPGNSLANNPGNIINFFNDGL